jgi:hypothetical protein
MSVFERILKEVRPGLELGTPYADERFTVKAVKLDRVVFFIKNIEIPVSKDSLNGIPKFLRNKGWVRIGAAHIHSDKLPTGTLEKYLRDTTPSKSKHSQASYVAPLLKYLKIVEIDYCKPTKIRLIEESR